MKVLAVIDYKKYVVIEVPDPNEQEIPTGDGGSSRQPNFEARDEIVSRADHESQNTEIEWVGSCYYKEADPLEIKANEVQEVNGTPFSIWEWFDL